MNHKVWPVLIVLAFSGAFWTFADKDNAGEDQNKQQQILTQAASLLTDKHYNPKPLDDNFSKDIYDKFLKELDADKLIFLKEDINALKQHERYIDDELKGAELKFFPAVNAIYMKRLKEVIALYQEILKKPMDFTVDETYVIENEKSAYPANDAERYEKLRKRIKFLTLERYTDLINQREKATDEKEKVKKDEELEKEAREKVRKLLDRYYDRLVKKVSEEDRFNMLINTVAEAMDPHTNYFPPVEKRAFDEQMSGRFFGIGAQLREEEGNIKIVSVVTGSPAWKSGQIQANDVIIKVAQGTEEAVDLSGYAVDDAVKIIRGDKGSEVRLTIKKPDGSIVVVTLIREKIEQDEIFARSTLINQADGKKIGIIYLPEFYANFEDPNGAHCAADVAKEIAKLKTESVDGIILDLRSNGGGSLFEVVKMVGFFIPEGPVVQVKDKEGNPSILRDTDRGNVLYDGPLAVIVNEFSASASEIFAAAIQDYKRGIVVGSTSTFGKGTVQRNFAFGKPLDFFSGRTEYGALKITQQKFYRINGGSTQLKGVNPDVVLPDIYEFVKFREKDNEGALSWDQIKAAPYSPMRNAFNYNAVKTNAEARVAANTNFSAIKKNTEWLNKHVDKKYSLNLSRYKQEQDAIKKITSENEKVTKLEKALPMDFLTVDRQKFSNNADTAKAERYKQWLNIVKTDIYIDETARIVSDMIAGQASVTKKD